MKEQTEKGTRRNDIVLILVLLLAAGLLWGLLRLTSRPGGRVRVSVDGTTVAVLPLDRDGSYTWEGERGSNTLVVQNGAARMEKADCPDGLCIRQGEIRRRGESIVCLPHRLVAVVEGEAEEGGPDAVAR